MKYRSLGRTGLKVSEIGFGAWAIGGEWGSKDDDAAVSAIHRAMDLGVNFIDTAAGYGDGHSERLIARAFRERGERCYVASKVMPKNYKWPALPHIPVSEVFPKDWIISITERSLKNLETDCIDLMQLHVWADRFNYELEWYEAMVKLQEQGKIRFIGVSLNDWDAASGVNLAKSGRVDSIQVIYNIFEQRPAEELFPAAIEFNIGIIARVPFEEGLLTGKIGPGYKFPEGDWRARWLSGGRLEQAWEHVQALRWVENENRTMAQAALKFILAHPAVSTVIPGMRSIKHVEENVAVSDSVTLNPSEVDRLKTHAWVHNFKYPWAADR
ncbi:MAG: aldo/keto reductase [Firmicutes bacterium]|nr:aldo/keto reductase [Bacillota bacterium]